MDSPPPRCAEHPRWVEYPLDVDPSTRHGPSQRAGASIVVKPEWGIKRLCQSCGARYYDFLKSPILCPSCETQFDPEAVLKSRRSRQIAAETPRKPAPETKADDAEDEEDEEETVEDEDEDDVGVEEIVDTPLVVKGVDDDDDDDDDPTKIVDDDDDDDDDDLPVIDDDDLDVTVVVDDDDK